jgi:glutaredoxin
MYNFSCWLKLALRPALAMLLVLLAINLAKADEPLTTTDNAAVLQVFVRDGCPHCDHAKTFLPGFLTTHSGVQLVYRPVDTDPEARDELANLSRMAGIWPPGVPTFVFQGRMVSGFANDGSSQQKLEALLTGQPLVPGKIDTGLFGTLSVERLGLPMFTLAIGLLDGFNPCAMWVLLFLLSMLVHLRDRFAMALVAGTFVLVSGAVYYAFMAAWLNIFLAVGLSAAVRITLAVLAIVIGLVNVKDFVRPGQGPSFSIPASAKPGIYARVRNIVQGKSLPFSLAAVASLAVMVNFIELLCTAGLPAIYTAILAQQGLDPLAHYAYLGLYILGYITDDSLMVVTAVYALSSNKLSQATGRWLKLLSGAVMLALGLVMLIHPEWLT